MFEHLDEYFDKYALGVSTSDNMDKSILLIEVSYSK